MINSINIIIKQIIKKIISVENTSVYNNYHNAVLKEIIIHKK